VGAALVGRREPHASVAQDGYPRTVAQAKALSKFAPVDLVVNITLPTHVLTAKILGRRVCTDCGRNYNMAEIKEGKLDMPPLLPKSSDCSQCNGKPRLITRADDTEEVVTRRLKVYEDETAPVLKFFGKVTKVLDFAVEKGVDDMPRLWAELERASRR
jgi:adenylate kinase